VYSPSVSGSLGDEGSVIVEKRVICKSCRIGAWIPSTSRGGVLPVGGSWALAGWIDLPTPEPLPLASRRVIGP
jgi:hypothetical protein